MSKEVKLSLFQVACSLPRHIPEDLCREIYSWMDPWRTHYRECMKELKQKVEPFHVQEGRLLSFYQADWQLSSVPSPLLFGALVKWKYHVMYPIDLYIQNLKLYQVKGPVHVREAGWYSARRVI